MIAIKNPVVTAHEPSGGVVNLLDARCVHRNLNHIADEFNLTYTEIDSRLKRVESLEPFIHWLKKHHPHIIHEFVVTKAAKEKLGVK